MDRPLQVGSNLGDIVTPDNYEQGMNVQYLSDRYYFNVPAVSWNGTEISTEVDSFDFVCFSGNNAESVPATQSVAVLNVNDPTDIAFKQNAEGISVYQYGSFASSKDTVATLDGFSLLEFDKNVDVVRAVISTANGGKLTLNPVFLSLVDFSSLEYCFAMGGVNCIGDGTLNSDMIFVGTPYAIESVLNGMTYLNDRFEGNDYVNISIYDGQVRYIMFCFCLC